MNLTRPLVAVWFGAAAIAAAAAVWVIMGVAMRYGLLGLAVLLVAGSAIAWPAAGSYLRNVTTHGDARLDSMKRHSSAPRAPHR